MALTATMGFEEADTILSYYGANDFNSMYRHRFLPALAEIAPKTLKEVRTNTPVPGARAVLFIDDITGHSTNGALSWHGSYRESYRTAAGHALVG